MDMNKKTWYWAIGVIAALLVIFLFWGMFRDNENGSQTLPSETSDASRTESSMDTGADNHAGMNHPAGEASTTDESGTDHADSDYTRYMEEETAIMDRMMRDMELTEENGNSALDFIAGMIPHHEAAVSMAESYLNHGGSHSQLKPLAEDIITAQKSEITQMKEMQKKITESGAKNQQQADAYRKEYDKMMAAHHADHGSMNHGTSAENSDTGASDSAGTSGSTGASDSVEPIDIAFASGMIMHHQMAVDMAKAILNNTDEQELLDLAQQIVDAQETEIAQMQEVLDRQ